MKILMKESWVSAILASRYLFLTFPYSAHLLPHVQDQDEGHPQVEREVHEDELVTRMTIVEMPDIIKFRHLDLNVLA